MQYLDYNECKQRGTFDFPIEAYHVDNQHPQYSMSYHWHVEYEIIRILKGELVISLNENEFRAVAGDVIFINGGTLHAGTPIDCIYECIVFDMNMLQRHNDVCLKYIQSIINHSVVIDDYFPCSSSELHQVMNKLFDTMNAERFGYQFIVQGSLYQMLGIILENNLYKTDSLQTSQNRDRIAKLKQALELIENSYASPITLEQLSKAAGMSPKYFCRFFKEMTHKKPIDYLNFYRIEHACYQLTNTDSPITDIAFNCGFNDLSYFIKTFKRYKGDTPKKYNKKSQVYQF